MGSSKKMWEAMMKQLADIQAKAAQPSQYETQMSNEETALNDWLGKRDYRNLPTGSNVDLLPVSEYQRMRQMVRGAPNDTAAQGVINPTILKQQQALGDDQFLRDWGNTYENKVGQLQGRKDALLGGLQEQHNTSIGQQYQGIGMGFQGLSAKPKSIWATLAPALIGGAASVATKMV